MNAGIRKVRGISTLYGRIVGRILLSVGVNAVRIVRLCVPFQDLTIAVSGLEHGCAHSGT